MDTITFQIRNFIIEQFGFNESEFILEETDSLVEKGIMDSVGLLELINWLEETYRINIENDDIIPKNFDSIGKIVNFVKKKNGMENQ
jgi:acyl carrier protein